MTESHPLYERRCPEGHVLQFCHPAEAQYCNGHCACTARAEQDRRQWGQDIPASVNQ